MMRTLNNKLGLIDNLINA